MSSLSKGISFLQWALPKLGYRWEGFRKPRDQVFKRIRGRMQQLELTGGYSEYRKYLQNYPGEWKHLDKLCDVTISKFFRDRRVWEFIRDRLFTDLLRNRDEWTVNIWSAGCCNGEEAYSLAIICEQLAKNSQIHSIGEGIFILASDRNPDVLKRARDGRYPSGALKELKKEEVSTFFYKIEDEENDFRIEDRLRRYISFEQRDISDKLPDMVFDLILCRNLVFTYFTEKRQNQFLDQLKPHLSPSGYFVVGSNEIIPQTDWLEPVSGTHPVYRLKP